MGGFKNLYNFSNPTILLCMQCIFYEAVFHERFQLAACTLSEIIKLRTVASYSSMFVMHESEVMQGLCVETVDRDGKRHFSVEI
jgi:hypothetical protein